MDRAMPTQEQKNIVISIPRWAEHIVTALLTALLTFGGSHIANQAGTKNPEIEIAILKEDIGQLKSDMQEIKADFKEVKKYLR